MTLFEEIYETMLGLREPEAQVKWVENCFEEDSFCTREYETMRQAYLRVCSRLGAGDEDLDLEIMVTALENIQKALCRQCFDLGMKAVMENRCLAE